MKPQPERLRDHFLGWQCRIRQIAMREHGGRPSPGMQPRVVGTADRELSPAVTVLLVPRDPGESTEFFRFQVKRTNDPRDAYERGLAFLQAEYFQQPRAFSDVLAAVLPVQSALAALLAAEGACRLDFDQFRQSYRLPCAVRRLPVGDAAREAALWHNRLFNPSLPETVHVLAFQPDWGRAEADPPPPSPCGEGNSL